MSTALPVVVHCSRRWLAPALLAVLVAGCTDGGSDPVEPPAEVPHGTATLEWSRPSSNEDGSALTDLAGYKVYYGHEAYTLHHVVDVRGADVSRAEIRGLEPGTWHFAIASYNSAGVESARSGVVTTTL